jgi:hypothetical protein
MEAKEFHDRVFLIPELASAILRDMVHAGAVKGMKPFMEEICINCLRSRDEGNDDDFRRLGDILRPELCYDCQDLGSIDVIGLLHYGGSHAIE